jgi:transposase
VVRAGIRWNDLPTTASGVSGATCWRRLKECHEAGVWQRLHETLLAELRSAGLLDLAHTVVDSSHLRALKGGLSPGPSPVDRGRLGSKHHLITDAAGIPLAVILTGGHRNDVTQLLRERGITPVIARRGTAHGSGLGRLRRVVERTFAWLHAFRRLRIRYERCADTHQAMISLASSIICLRNLLTSH